MTATALLHPFSPQGMLDPYPLLAAMRRIRPAFLDPGMGVWLLTSYELCQVALRNPAFSAAQGQQQRVREGDLPTTMLNTDGSEHLRLRSPAAAAFAARSISRWRPRVAALAAEVVRALPRGGKRTVDVVAEVAAPFATAVIGLAAGVGDDHWTELGRLARAASPNLNPILRGADAVAARSAAEALGEFLNGHADDAVLAGSELTPSERLGILSLIVVGGYEPLADLCSTALALILDTPGTAERLRGDPQLMDRAVDEAMRLESPIPFTSRVCVDGWTGADVTIPAGAPVLAMVGAANRDPAVFPDADAFSLDRPGNQQMALGAGVHHCLGAPLVRQATAALLTELLAASPDVSPAAGPARSWRPTLVPRGLTELLVQLPGDGPRGPGELRQNTLFGS